MLTAVRRLIQGHPKIVEAVDREGLSYLGKQALSDLFECVQELERRGRNGILVEAGCALGGSAIVMATAKSMSRPLYVYDVFGMIPPPSDADGADVHDRYVEITAGRSKGIGEGKYYGYEEELLQKVEKNFRQHGIEITDSNVHLVQGLFEDTLHIHEPVALAHIDGDWYESVKTSLSRIVPHMVAGGVLVIDDYEAWSGCRTAVDEFFADKLKEFDFVQRSRLHIVRKVQS